MLEVNEALERMLAAVSPLEPLDVPLAEALGRTLAEKVVADRDAPPTDRSAMDGFAVRTADTAAGGQTLRVVGELRAGRPAGEIGVRPGEAVRIFTGGVIPPGADAVVMKELAEEDGATGTVRVAERPTLGQHIRRRGEELRRGDTVVDAGTPVRAAEIAALAAVGRTRARVVRAPRVAVLSTGDEVVPAERAAEEHQVRNSNAWMLLAQLAELGLSGRDLGIAPDDPERLDAAIASGLDSDVLLLTGGVSVGAYDLVGAALARAGATTLFHGVAMRPGKPILVARRGSCLAVGLPGNPVSAFTGFRVFVVPALRKLAGEPEPVRPTLRATLLARLPRKPGRLHFALARLDWRDGRPVVAPVRSASSGDVLSLVRANALIVVPGDPHAIEAGTEVDVAP